MPPFPLTSVLCYPHINPFLTHPSPLSTFHPQPIPNAPLPSSPREDIAPMLPTSPSVHPFAPHPARLLPPHKAEIESRTKSHRSPFSPPPKIADQNAKAEE